ncbi:MAG: hypothetical protein IJA20_08320 [Methanocorpusculum sp.]|nr:hypothetical protein [Methanocorpusculum sp.]
MAELSRRQIHALRMRLAKIGFTLTGTRVRVLEADGDELGYTSGNGAVSIAFAHEYYKELTEEETISFITGTFLHEIMHLLQTNIALYTQTIRSLMKYEQQFMQDIYNILEDSSIEFFAPLYVSKEMMRDLNFMRACVYRHSPPIEEQDDPFLQFINASIQFGDAGLLKGHFTSKEAEECFIKCLPIMSKGVEEPDNRMRAKYARQLFELSRPLWQKHAKNNEAFEKFLDILRELLKDSGRGGNWNISGSAAGPMSPTESGDKPEENARSRRRKITFKRVSPEEFKKLMEEGGSGGSPGPNDDITVLIPDGPVSAEEMKGAAASLEAEGALSKEETERIQQELQKIEAEIAAADAAEREDAGATLDYSVRTGGYKKVCSGVRCKNDRSTINMEQEANLAAAYQTVVAPLQPTINKLTHQLERVLRQDAGETTYRTSGKASMKRLSSGRMRARVFTKRRVPSRSDVHICIAIDNSGSMGGNSIAQARTAAIVLAEVFGKMDLPTSIFGFTADTKGVDVYHEHFLTGRNTKRDRLRLMSATSRANNFDGYSIRYAASLLESKPQIHKLLIVISDGQPACGAYSSVDGITDTKLAIREASKNATVVGILVGHARPEIHKEMYGYNFLHIKDPKDLATGLFRCVVNQMKEW